MAHSFNHANTPKAQRKEVKAFRRNRIASRGDQRSTRQHARGISLSLGLAPDARSIDLVMELGSH